MEAIQKLDEHLRTRIPELSKLQKEGQKIIGYVPGAYMPEELVYACGAIPVQLIRGGDPEEALTSMGYMMRMVDTFCRSHVMYRLSGDEPLYNMVDLLIVPSTDHNFRAIGESWKYYTDVDIFKYGVPHQKDELALDYYLGSLGLLKEKLEKVTGNNMEDGKLREAIACSNRTRELFKEISLMRKSGRASISSRHFIKLNHASSYADRNVMVEVLESVLDELKEKGGPTPTGPRLLLTGGTLAMGDYKMLDLVEEAGGQIVIEYFDEGLTHYWENVETDGDLMKALADRYLMKQVVGAWFRPSRERLDFVVKLARDFKVNGIIWYQLMFRDSIDIHSFRLPPILKKELDIPMLKLESDWNREEKHNFRTRIETFIQMLG